MKSYTNYGDAPLLFHKFYWRYWLPVQIIMTVFNLFQTFRGMEKLDGFFAIDIAFFLSSAVLMAVSTKGLSLFKKYGFVCNFVQFGINLIYVVVLFFIYIAKLPDSVGLAAGNLFGTVVRCGLIGLYYYKRRALFTKQGVTPQQLAEIDTIQQKKYATGAFDPRKTGQNNGNTYYGNNNTYYGNQSGSFGAENQNANFGGNSNFDRSANFNGTAQTSENADNSFATDGIFCHNCGKKLPNNPNFCIYCGAKVK